MEPVVHDRTPLADYLLGEGEADQSDWAPAPDLDMPSSSPPSTPGFAPKGRPTVSSRFRAKTPNRLGLDIPHTSPLMRVKSTYSSAVASHIDRAENTKFLDQFRYTVIASQLLDPNPGVGSQVFPQKSSGTPDDPQDIEQKYLHPAAVELTVAAVAMAWAAAWLVASYKTLSKKQVVFVLSVTVIMVLVGPVHLKRQWLKFRRRQALSEIAEFISSTQNFDSAVSAAISLVQEVELVSRGYRISAPLPPISRIEERSQTRKCSRLRKTLRISLAEVIETYSSGSLAAQAFSEQLDLERYYDIYDISDGDIAEALQGYSEDKFDDVDSLITLKVLAARFHTIRRIFLCALVSLDANKDSRDLLRWTTVVEALQELKDSTNVAFGRIRDILSEESFPTPITPKGPLTPGRERFRAQMRKLNSLSTGIRGLQAKLQLLREESDRVLDSSTDIAELGAGLTVQYDSIGADLRDLIAAWEEGRTALALGIDRNEKRLSSMSTALLSPTTSLSGLTTVGEDSNAQDALRILSGEKPGNKGETAGAGSSRSPSSVGFSSAGEVEEAEEVVFEAVAMPRPRSLLTREERIQRMKEDRERRADAKEKADATKGMLRELEMVINLRPKIPNKSPGRVTSL